MSGHRFATALSLARRGGGLQCVPFARTASGIDIGGNAWTWWDQAAGAYERGARPEEGSVLAFRANGRMRLGHVAVVSKIVNAREVELDQANWSGGTITRGVEAVDVSEANDWTAVRVQMGSHGAFGSIYPTYGFIYDRPDNGVMVAAAPPAPEPNIGPAPSDLRPSAERLDAQEFDEVAEAPAHPRHIVVRHHVISRRHGLAQHRAKRVAAR